MKNIRIYISKLFVLVFMMITITSCQKEDLNKLETIIYVRHKGADIPAYIHGNASEKVFLIILHGGPGGDGLTYRSGVIKNEIEEECAVVYLDQRGSGMSQGKYSSDEINVDIMAEDIVAVTKVLQQKYGVESRFFLLGHSWGGTLGTAVLLEGNNQNIFKGWIEVDGAHDMKEMYYENIRFFKSTANEQIALNNSVNYWTNVLNKVSTFDTLQFEGDNFNYMNPEAYTAESKLTDDNVVIGAADQNDLFGAINNSVFKNNPLTTWWNGMITNYTLSEQEIWEKLSYTDQLHKIKIPSLVLWGRYDMVIPPKMGQDAFDNLGSTEKKVVFFEKSGHSPMDNEADKFALEVINFINQFK